MGDDVGWFHIRAYHHGIMSGKTPNLDKLAAQGMLFTDYFAEMSCTAGRAAFVTGEMPLRIGCWRSRQASLRTESGPGFEFRRHESCLALSIWLVAFLIVEVPETQRMQISRPRSFSTGRSESSCLQRLPERLLASLRHVAKRIDSYDRATEARSPFR